MNVDGTRRWPDWRSRPLCASYLAVHLTEQSTVVGGLGKAEVATFQWALGVVKEGQCEILGWWLDPPDDAADWSTIGADLSARGVERVRVLVASARLRNRDSTLGSGDARPVAGPLRPSASLESLPVRLQRHVRRASNAARGAEISLSRAIARHGAFACAKAAGSFVDGELQRVDRRLWPDSTLMRSRPGRINECAPARQLLHV
jgi:hypothetical protein